MYCNPIYTIFIYHTQPQKCYHIGHINKTPPCQHLPQILHRICFAERAHSARAQMRLGYANISFCISLIKLFVSMPHMLIIFMIFLPLYIFFSENILLHRHNHHATTTVLYIYIKAYSTLFICRTIHNPLRVLLYPA